MDGNAVRVRSWQSSRADHVHAAQVSCHYTDTAHTGEQYQAGSCFTFYVSCAIPIPMASFARPIANRVVHLHITPRPSSLGESREILRLISQFGEVEYFKNLKYDTLSAPNAALVVYKDEDAATDCLRKSPIRFRMGLVSEEDQLSLETLEADQTPDVQQPAVTQDPPRQRGPIGTPFGLGQARSMSTTTLDLPRPPRKQPPMPFIDRDEPLSKPSSRIFQLQANPARAHLRDHIDASNYHGSFAIDTKSAIQDDLAKRVPLLGLSAWNWRAPETPWRIMRKMKAREREGPERRKSLRELYDQRPEEGEAQSEEGKWLP